MSRHPLSLLKPHLHERRSIVQEHMYEGVARNKQQIDATAGAVTGEATRPDNKAKVYCGISKGPDIQSMAAPAELEEDDAEKFVLNKKKKARRDPLLNIVQEHMYEGVARNKQQIDATAGAVTGEATRPDNKAKVYCGISKGPDIQSMAAPAELEEDDAEKFVLNKKKKARRDPLLNIVQEHMYEGVARNKQQIDATAGAVTGEATRPDNKAKVYCGISKGPDIQSMAAPAELEEDDAEKFVLNKKKKARRDPLLNIVQEHMYEGVARNKQQIDATAGAVTGEATRPDNKAKVYCGISKGPDIQSMAAPAELEEGDAEKFVLNKKKKARRDPLLNIVQEHMYEGVARNMQQIDATAGAVTGEATRPDNKAKVYYGIPKGPDIQSMAAPAELEEDDAEKFVLNKKKKARRDSLFSKKTKSDPNAPPADRIPVPELKDNDKMEKLKAKREALKRVNLGPETLPSICCYTLLNSTHTVTCAEVSEDSSMLAVGFSESMIRVWSLVPQKLRAMKSADELADIDREADDVLVRMMDERSGETCKTLYGHQGPVYHIAFAPERTLLLSASEDTTVRLWSLQLWTCLVVYKGHLYPVWDVKFSPLSYYFATASHDKTARLWATDSYQPLRIFAGHLSDVDCVEFHPNSNYVATGSSDRTVCLWDVVTGNHVRVMTGHKSPVYVLAFSVEGRFLASGGSDQRVLVWDLADGHLVAELGGHAGAVHTLAFSRCGNVLASAALDCTVRLWDFARLADDSSGEDVNVSHNPDVRPGEPYLLRAIHTKSSPLLHLHFTRTNLLMSVAMLDMS